MDSERQALLEFKQGLIDETDHLVSWVGEDRNCCRWTGIVCDNITGHVHGIHLQGVISPDLYGGYCDRLLGGNLSSSLLVLKQLRHLDLSCNDFGGIQVPEFIGSLGNLRYLNLSLSRFNGIIPPQLGNLSRLHVLSVGSFHVPYPDEDIRMRVMNMQWLSSLRLLRHLDMSSVNLSKAIDWFQVINTLPSLTELHLSYCDIIDIHPHVRSLNTTSLSLLDLSNNDLSSFVPQWVFSITNLISLDFSWCNFHSLIHDNIHKFHNLTSLKSLHISGNRFMNSSLVLSGLSSTVASNIVSLKIGFCGITSSVLNSLHNLTSLRSLDLSTNELTKRIPKSFVNICNLRDIDLSYNDFGNVSLNYLLGDFLDCESHIGRSLPLEGLVITQSNISGTIPDFIKQLTFIRRLFIDKNSISGPIPHWIGLLSSLEYLELSDNRLDGHLPDSLGNLLKLRQLSFSNNLLDGSLPDSLGNLSKLEQLAFADNRLYGSLPHSLGSLSKLQELRLSNNRLDGNLPDSLGNLSELVWLTFSNNLLTGVVTEAHFAKLVSLQYLDGNGNNLTLRPRLANWIPPFWLSYLDLSSWSLGSQFPLWLQSQTYLTDLSLRNTGISLAMDVSFWKSFPYLTVLDMSHNHIQGTLLDFPRIVKVLDLSFNELRGELPILLNASILQMLDLSSNFFVGSVHHMLCSDSVKKYAYPVGSAINLGNNRLSGAIPECWDKWQGLFSLNLENNRFSGQIPGTLGSLRQLRSLNMRGNKLSGRIPASLKNLKELRILQIGRNELVGSIPKWLGNLSVLKILNLRSNNFVGRIPDELCNPTRIQILDLADNDLSGNIPRCFNNFSVLSGKNLPFGNKIFYYSAGSPSKVVVGSDSLVMKGREDTYDTILGLVMLVDLSSNNLVGPIPSELTALRELKSLNLSRNQLTGMIPEKIGDMKSLETLDLSLNKLSGKLPLSLSSLTFLVSFNVSWNQLTGRIPSSTQLQSFNESSFFGNKLCGDPLVGRCVPTKESEDNASLGADWGLIISIVAGLVVGFWLIVAPLMVSKAWRNAYFSFLSELRYMVYKDQKFPAD
uniref:receptor-like protein EIX2 n=1 Tax=Erigeron canadensis TaxID=72917 RepID=UPI001CB8DCA2|nr:receptor-like protein EIX2 [Erigeron canadensis]